MTAPAGFTTVSSKGLKDASGNLIQAATMYFQPVSNKGEPISFQAGGGGQVSSRPVQTQVVAGVFTINLADTTLTTPANVGYSATCIDALTGENHLGPGYGCIQPSGSVWNFDTYVPNLSAQAIVVIGPVGPAGPAGENGAAGIPGSPGTQGPIGPAGATANGSPTGGAIVNAVTASGNSNLFLTTTQPANPGTQNVVLGVGAGGYMAMDSSGTGAGANVVIGYEAGAQMTTARECVIIGDQAGANITGNGSNGPDDMIFTLIGSLAGNNLTTKGGAGVMIGQKCGAYTLSSSNDVFMGTHCGTAVSTSSGSVFLGASMWNTLTKYNMVNSTFTGSVIGGTNAGSSANAYTVTGASVYGSNTAINLRTSDGNSFFGYNSGGVVTTGQRNTFLGAYTGTYGAENDDHNTTIGTGSYNLVIGGGSDSISPGAALTSGSNNTLINNINAGQVTSGNSNLLVGISAGAFVKTTSNSIILGPSAGAKADIAQQVSIGYAAGGGPDCVVIGTHANDASRDGSGTLESSIVIGHLAASGVYGDLTESVIIGDNAQYNGTTATGLIILGANANVAGGVSNAIQLGAGTNGTVNTLQVWDSKLVDSTGQVFSKGAAVNPVYAYNMTTTTSTNGYDLVQLKNGLEATSAFTLTPRNQAAAQALASGNVWIDRGGDYSIAVYRPNNGGMTFDIIQTVLS